VARPSSAEGTYALIELKAPGEWGGVNDKRIRSQLFALTAEEPEASVLSFSTLQVNGDGQVVLTGINISRKADLTYEKWRQRKSPYVDNFPVNYDEPTSIPFTVGGTRDLNLGLTRGQLDRTRVELHNKLWGGSRDDNQIYAWLVRLFLTKIYDERHTSDGDPYDFQVLYDGTKKESANATFMRVNKRYQAAYSRYINDKAKSDEALTGLLFSVEELQWVVETLQQASLTSVASTTGDLLGGFFEAITREGFKQSKGLFFTHYNVAVFMLEALDLGGLALDKINSTGHTNDRLPYIIDPSCGSGTFLLAAMRMVTGKISEIRSKANTADVRDQLAS
jgi:type I restriction enzyme M protein